MANNKYYGMYRAIVADVVDPEERGRIRVVCPSVTGEYKSNWCVPCFFGAKDNAGDFYLPPIGETIWIGFEEGDKDKPIYFGNWWSPKKSPITDYSLATSTRVIEFNGCKITMKQNEAKIIVGESSITLTPTTVTIKSGDKIYLN